MNFIFFCSPLPVSLDACTPSFFICTVLFFNDNTGSLARCARAFGRRTDRETKLSLIAESRKIKIKRFNCARYTRGVCSCSGVGGKKNRIRDMRTSKNISHFFSISVRGIIERELASVRCIIIVFKWTFVYYLWMLIRKIYMCGIINSLINYGNEKYWCGALERSFCVIYICK